MENLPQQESNKEGDKKPELAERLRDLRRRIDEALQEAERLLEDARRFPVVEPPKREQKD